MKRLLIFGVFGAGLFLFALRAAGLGLLFGLVGFSFGFLSGLAGRRSGRFWPPGVRYYPFFNVSPFNSLENVRLHVVQSLDLLSHYLTPAVAQFAAALLV